MEDQTEEGEYSQYHVDHRPISESTSPAIAVHKARRLKKSVPQAATILGESMSELVSIHMSESSILENLGKHHRDILAAGHISNQVHDEMTIHEEGDADEREQM